MIKKGGFRIAIPDRICSNLKIIKLVLWFIWSLDFHNHKDCIMCVCVDDTLLLDSIVIVNLTYTHHLPNNYFDLVWKSNQLNETHSYCFRTFQIHVFKQIMEKIYKSFYFCFHGIAPIQYWTHCLNSSR